MKRMLPLSLLAGALANSLAIAQASAVAGGWEGDLHGAKAITLTVRERGGRVSGHAVFYIIRDEGSGWQTGSASPEIPLNGVQWDGAVLRFFITGSNGRPVPMEMKVTGPNSAELTRPANRQRVRIHDSGAKAIAAPR